MPARKRFSLIVALLGVMGVAAGVVRQQRGPALEVQPLRRAELVQRVVVSGRVLPLARINLGSVVSGRVVEVAVEAGQRVEAGAALIVLDQAEAQASLRQAQSGRAQAAARLQQAHTVSASVATEAHRQADAVLEAAQTQFARTQALQHSGSVSQVQVDEATRALAVARAQHASAEAQDRSLHTAGAEHALALATYAQAAAALAAAEVRLDQLVIRAPTAATVLTRSVEPGDVVQPGKTLLVLAKRGQTQLIIEPDEKNLAVLRVGQAARASADAFAGQSFAASVSYVAPAVDPQRGTVEVHLDVPEPPAYLRADMTVSVDIEVGRKLAALVAPTESIRELDGARPRAFVLQHGRVQERAVQLGLRGDGVVELLRGAREGEALVLQATAELHAGMRAHPRR